MGKDRRGAVKGEQESDTSIHPPPTVFSCGFISQEALSAPSLCILVFILPFSWIHLALLERCSGYHPNALEL